MNNRVVKTKQSIIGWMIIILLGFGMTSLPLLLGLDDFISWICLIFFGLGSIVLIIGFITCLINQPGITIDFNKRQIILNTVVILRKSQPMIINFDEIKNIEMNDMKMITRFFVETKCDLINGNKRIKQFYGYLNEENILAASSMYITQKSKKQVAEAIEQLKEELNIND